MKQREIKFRAYHKIQKRMFEVYGLGLDFVTENTLDGVSPGDNCWQGDELKNIEIMQFTGLKDKNGVEIYEGDLVKMTGSDVAKLVVYYDQAFYIKNSVSHTRLSKTLFYGEVIGNIHEHKHLLK